MTLAYVRRTYGVPAKRGGKVKWRGMIGTITSATHHINIKFPDQWTPRTFHPLYSELTYLDEDGNEVEL